MFHRKTGLIWLLVLMFFLFFFRQFLCIGILF